MKKFTTKINDVMLAGAVYVISTSLANAANGLPTSVVPGGQTMTNNGDWLELAQRNFYSLMVFAGLLVSSIAFLVVSKNVIGTYGDIKENKATWGALGAHAGTGMIVLALVIYLLTQAKDILKL